MLLTYSGTSGTPVWEAERDKHTSHMWDKRPVRLLQDSPRHSAHYVLLLGPGTRTLGEGFAVARDFNPGSCCGGRSGLPRSLPRALSHG